MPTTTNYRGWKCRIEEGKERMKAHQFYWEISKMIEGKEVVEFGFAKIMERAQQACIDKIDEREGESGNTG